MPRKQKSAKKGTKNPTTTSKTFTAEEREAMKERARELKTNKTDGATALQDKIAAMSGSDKSMATKLHALITKNAPGLTPKTWYGMPAYANKDGKVVCYFQSAAKFKARYATFGFDESARLDEGNMWPTSFALKKLTKTDEAKIVELVKKAVG